MNLTDSPSRADGDFRYAGVRLGSAGEVAHDFDRSHGFVDEGDHEAPEYPGLDDPGDETVENFIEVERGGSDLTYFLKRGEEPFLLLQVAGPALALHGVEDDARQQLWVCPDVQHVVLGPGPHGLQGGLLVVGLGEDDGGHAGRRRPYFLKRHHALGRAQEGRVEEEDIRCRLPQRGDCRAQLPHAYDLRVESPGKPQYLQHRLGLAGIAFQQENIDDFGGLRLSGCSHPSNIRSRTSRRGRRRLYPCRRRTRCSTSGGPS